jgi:hypothetical protein
VWKEESAESMPTTAKKFSLFPLFLDKFLLFLCQKSSLLKHVAISQVSLKSTNPIHAFIYKTGFIYAVHPYPLANTGNKSLRTP